MGSLDWLVSKTDSVSTSMPLNEDAARAIAACLCEDGCAAPVMAHLDAVLAWLIQPERPSSRPLDEAILEAGLTREQAVERAYGLLDELLLGLPAEAPEETLGLKGETDPGVIKQRYRRLIAVYHPDRHPAHSADLNRRTERINRAYRLVMQRDASADSEWSGGAARARSPRPSAKASAAPPAWTSRSDDFDRRPPPGLHARPHAGALARHDASLIQRRLIQAMVLGCAALLAILLLGEDPADEPHGARSPVVAQPIAATVAPAVEPPRLMIGPSPAPLKSPSPLLEPTPEVAVPASLLPRDALLALEPAPAPDPGPAPEVLASPSISPLKVLLASEPAPAPGPGTAFEPAQGPEPPPEVVVSAAISPLEVVLASEPVQAREPAKEPELAKVREPAPEPVPEPRRARPVAEPPAHRATVAALPAVPTIAKAAPPPKMVQTPKPVAIDTCTGVSEALGRFRQAYQTGSADGLANLFTLDARERETAGRASIRRLYADWFSSTSGRSISFAGASTQSVGKDLCRIRVRFDVAYRDAEGRARSQMGQIRALFKRDGGRTLIQELSY